MSITTTVSKIVHTLFGEQVKANKEFILSVFKQYPDANFTAQDIATTYKLNRVHVSCRLSELYREGLIHPIGVDIKANKTRYSKFKLTSYYQIEFVKHNVLMHDFKIWVSKSKKFEALLETEIFNKLQSIK
jgi:hypothetical protein